MSHDLICHVKGCWWRFPYRDADGVLRHQCNRCLRRYDCKVPDGVPNIPGAYVIYGGQEVLCEPCDQLANDDVD